jgi:hypothetical protein
MSKRAETRPLRPDLSWQRRSLARTLVNVHLSRSRATANTVFDRPTGPDELRPVVTQRDHTLMLGLISIKEG